MTKKLPQCKSINEYRGILWCYNSPSAEFFGKKIGYSPKSKIIPSNAWVNKQVTFKKC